MNNNITNGLLLAASLTLAACGGGSDSSSDTASPTPEPPAPEPTVTNALVVENFAEVAEAMMADSLTRVEELSTAINTFLNAPSDETLDAAKAAYRLARVPYQQAEVLRFDAENGHVSDNLTADGGPASIDDWEGQVNAWPLDEGLIDYIDPSLYQSADDNEFGTINVIASTELMVNGNLIDTSSITPELIASFNEIGGTEANVATGVHAIEFLLWGQDVNGTNEGAGQRPVSDYFVNDSQGGCTSGVGVVNDSFLICQRRADYLTAAVDLLVSDLTEMAAEWNDNAEITQGTLRYDFVNRGDGLARILDSMGDMAAGELASERMRVAILFGSTEDEHDCFSDNTHVALFNNAQGVVNAYRGSYTRIDGTVVSGASISDLVASEDEALNTNVEASLDLVLQGMQGILDLGDAEQNARRFDQLVGGTNEERQMVLEAASSLLAFADLLGDEVAGALQTQLQEFDTGTCPTNNVDDCDS